MSRADDKAGRTEDSPSATNALKRNGVARLDDARPDDPGVHPGPAGMEFGGKAGEIPVRERAHEVFARVRRPRDLEDHVADRESGPGLHEAPLESGNREVLSGGAAIDWMPVGPKCVDEFLGEQTHRPIGTAVISQIPLSVSFKTIRSDANRVNHAELGNASVRDLDRLKTPPERSADVSEVLLVRGHGKRKITRSELTDMLFRIHTVGRPEGPSTFPAGRQFWRIHV